MECLKFVTIVLVMDQQLDFLMIYPYDTFEVIPQRLVLLHTITLLMDLLDLVFFAYQGNLSMETRVEEIQSNITTFSTNSTF